MRKCVWAILLAGCICLNVGCGAIGAEEEAPAAVTEQESDSLEEVTGQQTPPAEEEPSAGEELRTAPEITVTSESVDQYSEDGSLWLIHTDYDMVEAAGEGYEALVEGMVRWSEEHKADILKETEQYAVDAEEYAVMTGNGIDDQAYSLAYTLEPMRADNQVVSLLEMGYAYLGGAHGDYWYDGVTFDSKSGEILALEDILKDAGGFRKEATGYITEKLQEDYGEGLFPDYATTVEKMWENDPAWYLDAAGITFIFNPYEVGPYAMGEARVTLPKAEFAEYLEEDYADLGFEGYAQLPENMDIPLHTPLSSQLENILRLDVVHKEEYGMAEVSVKLNGSTAKTGIFDRISSAYLVNTGMFTFVVMDVDYASDDYVTMVYNVSTGVANETDRLEGTRILPEKMGAARMALGTRIDVFGTYTGIKTYTIDGKSGTLQTEDPYFYIIGNDSPFHVLTTVQELPVVDAGEETTLPIGSRIRITATDNEGVAVFEDVDTGIEGEIHYVRGDGKDDTWTIHVNGIPEQEYFEEYLPYAG